ncbi:trehalose-phosphatase [Chelativorans sp. Marseille-P2723]|uniref:trehalose-phosphatase n=1 Tax=Chelativorans sp. Marseille-P2723 TaxID=2709133 RepID=UPI00156D7F0D|nr:trehalose-phosphatase [Chelativorans sp. Marseille-P2723]
MTGQPAPLISLDPSNLKPESTALFLDFDGTLADIAEHPDAVSVPAVTCDILRRLERSTQGALAIVTGRPIDHIDRFLAPLYLPVAGVHGLERRTARGTRSAVAIDEKGFGALKRKLKAFADANPGLLFETKRGSIALHYRQRPELADAAAAAVHAALDGHSGLHILSGKMVIEIKAGEATKADAIAAFMKELPFRGRRPLFAGDDVTDEDAFREVARSEGISIKIGSGTTAASFRSEGTDAFRAWLARLADCFDSQLLTEQGL